MIPEGDSEAEAREMNHRQAKSEERKSRLDEPRDMRYDAYLSLLDGRIRNAWVLGPIALETWISFRMLTESISYTFFT